MSTSTKAVTKYKQANYDRVSADFPKGERRIINDHAAMTGETLGQFLRRAVYETIEADREKFRPYDSTGYHFNNPAFKDLDVEMADKLRSFEFRMARNSLLSYEDWLRKQAEVLELGPDNPPEVGCDDDDCDLGPDF